MLGMTPGRSLQEGSNGLTRSLPFLYSNKLLHPLVRKPEQFASISSAQTHRRQRSHCRLESLCCIGSFLICPLSRRQSAGQRAAGP